MPSHSLWIITHVTRHAGGLMSLPVTLVFAALAVLIMLVRHSDRLRMKLGNLSIESAPTRAKSKRVPTRGRGADRRPAAPRLPAGSRAHKAPRPVGGKEHAQRARMPAARRGKSRKR
jgi:hypothetical protein